VSNSSQKEYYDKIITKEFIQEEHYNKGKSLLQIENETGICRKSIERRMNKLGLKNRHFVTRLTEEWDGIITKEFLIEEYINKKRTSRSIAKQLGVTRNHILYRLEQHGIPTRTYPDSRLPFGAVISEETKWCPRCQKNVPIEMFGKNSDRPRGLYNYCKDCDKKYRIENAEQIAARIKKRRGVGKSKIIMEKGNKCAVCGAENLPTASYTFHHINPDEKEYAAGYCSYANKKVLKEIREKCILVCFNCHMVLHHGDKTAKDYLEGE
jgi:AraC-like DNA-binding protein